MIHFRFGGLKRGLCLFGVQRQRVFFFPQEGVRQRKKPLQLIGKIFAAVFTGGGMGVMVILAGETGLWLESQETDALILKRARSFERRVFFLVKF